MIGLLKGRIEEIEQGSTLIDVGGVGYAVYASNQTLSRLDRGEAATLYIETHVREDHIHLFGFVDKAEKEWFRLLTSVQGVGAKAALAILSVCTAEQIQMAIAAQDKAPIQRADGVGPKLAQRVVTELKDKAAKIDLSGFTPRVVSSTSATPTVSGNSVSMDAVSALENLGYGRSEAFAAVNKAAADNDDADVSALIKLSLKALAS